MNIHRKLSIKPCTIALIALMAATRFHHFGTAFSLPDASLAVFFLAGLWFSERKYLLFLLLEAIVIDYVAITQFSVSDFCISSAYVFLLPSYLALWFAGIVSQRYTTLSLSHISKQFVALLTSASLAYTLSNSSFFLFSNNSLERSWHVYVEQFFHYFASYIGAALIYAVLIVAVVHSVKYLSDTKTDREMI